MRPRTILASLVAMSLAAPGCGLLRRRNNVSTNASSSVEVNNDGRDLATLRRDEYEIIETSIGEDKQVGVFLLTIPIGQQTTKDEGTASAYYAAVDRVPDCDALMMPRVSVKRTLIPLLLVNIVIRKTLVKGRCAHLKGERKGQVNPRGTFVDDDAPAAVTPSGGSTPSADVGTPDPASTAPTETAPTETAPTADERD